MTIIPRCTVTVTDAAGQTRTAEAPTIMEAVAALGRRHRLPEEPRWRLTAKGQQLAAQLAAEARR